MYKLLIMLLAFINSKQRRSIASAFANGNEALFLNKREKHHSLDCVWCGYGCIDLLSLLLSSVAQNEQLDFDSLRQKTKARLPTFKTPMN